MQAAQTLAAAPTTSPGDRLVAARISVPSPTPTSRPTQEYPATEAREYPAGSTSHSATSGAAGAGGGVGGGPDVPEIEEPTNRSPN